jgi:uncharacterized damage-inducible protein DinB
MVPARLYAYLWTTRGAMLEAVRMLTPEQYGRHFPFGLGTVGSTLTHLMISEWYYVERLDGRSVPPYAQWPVHYETPPPFAEVERLWREQMVRVRTLVDAQRDWDRRVAFDSFPNDEGKRFHVSMTAGDLFAQLALHEVHHRAQIMAMLRQMGGGVKPLEDIDYGYVMFERRPMD